MIKNVSSLNTTTGLVSILSIPGTPEDKEKMPARFLTALTVLFLIFAGSPLANININTVSAETNPYATTGSIIVNTNNPSATFTITGPATYTGSGTSWSQADVPAGTYTITYNPILGYDTPPGDTQTLVSGGTITFTGTYNDTIPPTTTATLSGTPGINGWNSSDVTVILSAVDGGSGVWKTEYSFDGS